MSRPKTRAETTAETRRKLLEAARLEVMKSGTAASIRDIATRAGYTQGAVYAQFKSKEVLLLALMSDHFDEVNASLDALLNTIGKSRADALEKLEGWIQALIEDEGCAIVEMELALFAQRNPEFAANLRHLLNEHTTALARHIVKIGELFDTQFRLPPEQIAASMIALSQGAKLNPNVSSSELSDILADYIKNFLVPSAGEQATN